MRHSNIQLLSLMTKKDIKFSKSDDKIIDFILRQPNKIVSMSIAVLATSIDVSEPTINRFCHKLGCLGYPDFKLKLAQELAKSTKLFSDNVDVSDNTKTVTKKIISTIQTSVKSLEQTLDPKIIDETSQLFTHCKSVNFFGMGASGPVALDAQHKFFRLGMPVIAHTDSINQQMICSMLGKDDIAVFISYSGRTKAMVDNAKIARSNNAYTIGITKANSPLSTHCDYVLNAITTEDTDLYTPMTSRIIHLAIIDILAITAAIKLQEQSGNTISDNIEAVKRNLQTTRYADNNESES